MTAFLWRFFKLSKCSTALPTKSASCAAMSLSIDGYGELGTGVEPI